MIRTVHVAVREFSATVFTKGFLIGFLVLPLVMFVAIAGAAVLFNKEGPKVKGSVAIIDLSPGEKVAAGFAKRMTPEAIAADAEKSSKELKKLAKEQADKYHLGAAADQALSNPATDLALKQALQGPELKVEHLAPTVGVDEEKARVFKDAQDADHKIENPRLALIVVPPTSVQPDAEGKLTSYDLFIRPRLDIQVQENIENRVRESLIDARLDTAGMGADRERIRSMVFVPRPEVKEVTREGDKQGIGEIGFIMPMAFMMLLWISVFTAGQYLLTSTIEEKSSRVMEVLLSAVSSRELMVGKILGQMCVGLVILLTYSSLGIGSLVIFSLMHLIDPMNLVYLFIFFLIAFFLIASFMAAIGSAVSDMREAQALMTPVMLVLMVPMLLWMPISRDPNGTFATVLSFLPPVNPFVMVLRIPAAAGSIPVPFWQIALSILIGVGAMVFMAWAAAKIFRVGVLMYGKPPNLATLIKWVRMA